MKEVSCTEMTAISGAGADIEQLKPLPGTDAPTTGDAPFIHGKLGYKENDIPANALSIECTK
ncbi:hypothetical protein EPW57_21415 [Salmonella enterica]|nr:hypothetical protein [Salmonella enterica]